MMATCPQIAGIAFLSGFSLVDPDCMQAVKESGL